MINLTGETAPASVSFPSVFNPKDIDHEQSRCIV